MTKPASKLRILEWPVEPADTLPLALWSSAEIAEAVGGTASAEFLASGVATDSREVIEGTLFFALGAWLEPRRRNVPLAVGIVLLGIGLLTYLSEAAYLQSTFAQPMISNNYLLGSIPFSLGSVLIALARPNLGGIAAEVGVYSLGLYALHAYVIEVLMRLPYGRAFSDFPFLFSLLVFALSFAAIRLLSRIRWMRALIM